MILADDDALDHADEPLRIRSFRTGRFQRLQDRSLYSRRAHPWDAADGIAAAAQKRRAYIVEVASRTLTDMAWNHSAPGVVKKLAAEQSV
ncbi:MAG: hypothetical protein AAGH48_07825 [Pseudomonadota bacterium]